MDRKPSSRCLIPLLALLATPGGLVAESADRLAVTTRPVGELFVAVESSAPATTEVLQRTRIAARLAAPVEQFTVETGDHVDRGEILARLECVDATDAHDAARARLREAESQARLAGLQRERLRRLREEDAASAEALDQAEAEHAARSASVEARRAEFTRAQRDVERCTVTATVAGMITTRHQSTGDFVQPGTPLLTLVARDAVELRAEVTDADAETLATASIVEFRTVDRVFPLVRPRRIGVVDPDTRTEEFRFSFDGTPPLPGRSGRLYWRSHRRAVPADLPVRRDDRLGLFVADDGHARFHPLPDAVEGRPALTDLAPDTPVLIEGRHAARDGMPIEIVE